MNGLSSIKNHRATTKVIPISNTRLDIRIVKLIEAGTDVFSAIKGASKQELIRARQACSNIGWRSEIVFDAALCDVEHARNGRGNADKNGTGVMAAMRRQAAETRVSVPTIKQNIRIFKTFFKNGINNYPILVDKSFFLHALRAKDPLAALKHFERMVSSDEEFSTSSAKQWVDSERAKRNSEANKILSKETPLARHIRWAKKEIIKIKDACPVKKFAERMYEPLLDDLEDHLAFMAETEAEGLCKLAWERGYHREAQIATATRLTRKAVAAAMLRLSAAQEFYEVKEVTHGRHDKRWQKAGVPIGSDFQSPSLRKTG